MNSDFEQRWKAAAASVRGARAEATDASPPFGFATRVAANWQAARERFPSAPMLWQSIAVRVLGAMALVLAALVALDFWLGSDWSPLQPPIEETMGEQLAWLN